MTHRIRLPRRGRPLLLAALAAVLALLALVAPGRAAAARSADASYLADGADGLQFAIAVHAGRLQAYACDGTRRRAFFTGRARPGRLLLRSQAGDRLALRLGARRVAARLTLNGAQPLRLTARRAKVAIFTTTIQPNGAVLGTAPGGGVLGAHLSGLGLVGALALPGGEPRAFAELAFARAPLFIDGRAVPFPPDRAAEALAGEWRWIVTPRRVVGATTKVLDLGNPWGIAGGTKFAGQNVGI